MALIDRMINPGPVAPVVYGYQATVPSGALYVLTFDEPMERVMVGVVGNQPLALEGIATLPPLVGNGTMFVQGNAPVLLAFGPGVLITGLTLRHNEPGPLDVRINAVKDGVG